MTLVMRVLVLVGVALFVGGLVIGLTPVESMGSACGSAFFGESGFHDALVGSVGCSEMRSATLPWASFMVVTGLVIGAGAFVVDPSWNRRLRADA